MSYPASCITANEHNCQTCNPNVFLIGTPNTANSTCSICSNVCMKQNPQNTNCTSAIANEQNCQACQLECLSKWHCECGRIQLYAVYQFLCKWYCRYWMYTCRAQNCTSCNPGWYLSLTVGGESTCVQCTNKCPNMIGKLDSEFGTVGLTCTGPNQIRCQTCVPSLFLTAPAGSLNAQCHKEIQCDPSCASCSGPLATDCVTSRGTFLSGALCVRCSIDCPDITDSPALQGLQTVEDSSQRHW